MIITINQASKEVSIPLVARLAEAPTHLHPPLSLPCLLRHAVPPFPHRTINTLLLELGTRTANILRQPLRTMAILRAVQHVGIHTFIPLPKNLPAYTDHSAASHQQYPSTYSTQFPDPFATQGASSFNPEGYNSTGYLATAPTSFPNHNYNAQSGYSAGQHAQPERSYTLGGDGYGSNTIPDFSHPAQYSTPAPYPTHTSPGPISPQHTPSPGPINTNVATASHMSPTSPRGPRPPATSEQPLYEDSPPMYDAATAQPPGQWGAKH